jgi:HD superfamily phosphohydrolase
MIKKENKISIGDYNASKFDFFRDPLYKDMKFPKDIVHLIDTPYIQRLRGISQLGVISWVFPGATHTRFQHSLGTMHIGYKIMENLIKNKNENIDDDCIKMIMIGCLFHDSGVPTFSHDLYEHGVLKEEDSHELKSALIAKNTIKKIQNVCSFTADEIYHLILPSKNSVYTDIISGTIDADRIDYLNRDSLYTGVAYGLIDARIILELKVDNNRLILTKKGVAPAISLLFARYSMRENVYDHRTSRILGGLISRGLWYAINDKKINKNELFDMNDSKLISILKKEKETKDYIADIEHRTFPRLARTWDLNEISDHIKDLQRIRKKIDKRIEIERELAKKIKLEEKKIYFDIPDIKRYVVDEANIPVERYNGKKLGEDDLAKAVGESHHRLFSIRLYAPKEYVKTASIKFDSVYDLS